MLRVPAVLAVCAVALLGLSVCAATAAPGSVKQGRPMLPPSPPDSARELQALARHPYVLVAIAPGGRGERIVRAAGGTLVSQRLGLWRVAGPASARVVEELRRAGALRYAEPDWPRSAAASAALPAEPFIGDQGWLLAIGADLVQPPGPGVPLTIIDTGLDPTHPEFVNRPETTFLNNPTFPGPGEDHGTAVASVAAAPVNGVGIAGVYPAARLRVFDAGALSCSDVVQGIDSAVGAGGDGVINGSYGSSEYCFSEDVAVQTAFGTGSIFVAAAGNEFQEGNPTEYPAALFHVLTVAATDPSDQPAFFSNAGLHVDLAAPGVDIIAAGFDDTSWFWEFVSGTSFSAPMVAAATAWVWTARPELDHTQVFNLMRYSARDVWQPGWDPDTGFGVLDIAAAMSQTPPIRDQLEPNDDVFQVKAHGLFVEATPSLTTPTKLGNRLIALLDYTEDPVDVYRAYIPGKGKLKVRLVPDGDVDLQVFGPGAKTVYGTKGLVATSNRSGSATETITVENSAKRGTYVYVTAYLPKGGPLDAFYRLYFKATAPRRR